MEALLGFIFGIVFWLWIIISIRSLWRSYKESKNWSQQDKQQIKKDLVTGLKGGIKTVLKRSYLFK